jgi:hypothetical protein
MKVRLPGKYFMAGFILVATAALLIVTALVTNRGDITTASVVIAGMVCAVTGIFVLTFSGGEPFDPRVVGMLPVQDQISLCRIAADLGITGTAYFLPSCETGEKRIMQFNPVADFQGIPARSGDSFPSSGPAGLVTVPSCDPFIRDLEKRAPLPKTDKDEELTRLLRETVCGIFEFAPKITAVWAKSTVTVTLHGYRFTEGCRIVARESPRCCTMHPCAACSLCGALIAHAKEKVASLDQCTSDPKTGEVTAVFSLLPGNSNP